MSHKVIWNQRGDELSLFLKFLIIKMYQFHKKNDDVYSSMGSMYPKKHCFINLVNIGKSSG